MWDTSGSQRCKRLRVEMQNYMEKKKHNLTPQNKTEVQVKLTNATHSVLCFSCSNYYFFHNTSL